MGTRIDGRPPAGACDAPVSAVAAVPERPARDQEIYHLVHRLFWSMNAAIECRTRQHGIHPGQWNTLRQLWCRDGVSQHVLGRWLGYRDSTLTTLLGKMEAGSLVYRKANPLNRREKLVFLTERARALETILLPVARDLQDTVNGDFTAGERAMFQVLLTRANGNFGVGDSPSQSA